LSALPKATARFRLCARDRMTGRARARRRDTSRPPRGSNPSLSDHGDGLNLQENIGIGETDDRDQRRDGKVLLQDLAAQLEEFRAMALVLEKDRHVDEIGELAAGLGELRFDVAEALPRLALDVAIGGLARRIAVTRLSRDPDMRAADRLDDRRIAALGFERT